MFLSHIWTNIDVGRIIISIIKWKQCIWGAHLLGFYQSNTEKIAHFSFSQFLDSFMVQIYWFPSHVCNNNANSSHNLVPDSLVRCLIILISEQCYLKVREVDKGHNLLPWLHHMISQALAIKLFVFFLLLWLNYCWVISHEHHFQFLSVSHWV